MNPIPETAKRADWPRLVAQKVNPLEGRTKALETATNWAALANYTDDTAAAAGGVPIGGLYRNGSVVQVRVL